MFAERHIPVVVLFWDLNQTKIVQSMRKVRGRLDAVSVADYCRIVSD